MIQSGQTVVRLFTTESPTTRGVMNADTLPTATLYVNGVADAAIVTVAAGGTGVYSTSVTLPTLTAGDFVALVASATVDGVPSSGVIWEDSCDAKVAELAGDMADTLRFLKNKQTAPRTGVGALVTYDDDGVTPKFSQTITDDGVNITRGAA